MIFLYNELLIDNEYIDLAFRSLDLKLEIMKKIYKENSNEVNLYLNEICNIYDKYIQYILKDTSIKYEKSYLKALNYCKKILKTVESHKELSEIWKLKEEEIFFNYILTHISMIDCEANFIYNPNSESIISRHYNFDDEGLQLYDELIKLNPNNPLYYYYKGIRLAYIMDIQRKRNYSIDLSHFTMNKSKNKNAKNPTTERLKNAIYYFKNKNFYDELLFLYIKAHELDKTNEIFINQIIYTLEQIIKYSNYIKTNNDKIKKYII